MKKVRFSPCKWAQFRFLSPATRDALSTYFKRQRQAQAAFGKALREKRVPDRRGEPCTDCGRPAVVHDHPDYRRPFDVEPVCVGCNVRRRHALDYPPMLMILPIEVLDKYDMSNVSVEAVLRDQGYAPRPNNIIQFSASRRKA